MSASTSLGECLEKAIEEWVTAEGGGFPQAFVCIVDYINAEGKGMTSVAKQTAQPVHRTLGLTTFLDEWYRDDCRRGWAGCDDDD